MAGVGMGPGEEEQSTDFKGGDLGKRGEGATGGTGAMSSVLDSGMGLKCRDSRAEVGSSVGSSAWRLGRWVGVSEPGRERGSESETEDLTVEQ